MKRATRFSLIILAAVSVLSSAPWLKAQAQQQAPQSPDMTFFITGSGPGKGADLGGIEGADRYCQELAQRAGAGSKTWRAYLSTQAADGKPAVNARDRIGPGPWQNFKGEIVAQNVDDLHSDNNKLSTQTSLTEPGVPIIPGMGYAPNRRCPHRLAGGWRTFRPANRTCGNWTSSTGDPMLTISTARVRATMQRRGRGTHRIPRADQTAAAAKPISAAPAVTGFSIALQLNSCRFRDQADK
jgi:hypothetical protein